MLLLVTCWSLSQLMRHCFLYTSFRELPFSVETSPLIKAHVFHLVCGDMEAYTSNCSFQIMLQGFGLSGCDCQKRYVIGIVCVRNCLYGVSPAFFLCQLETVIFHFIKRRSKHIVYRYDLPNPSARTGYDTRSIFKRGLTGLWIQSFPSPRLVASPRLKNLVRPTIYP